MTPQLTPAPVSSERNGPKDDDIGDLGDALAGVNLSGIPQPYAKNTSDGLSWASEANNNNQDIKSGQNLLFGSGLSDHSSPPGKKSNLDFILNQNHPLSLGEEVLKLQSLTNIKSDSQQQQQQFSGFNSNHTPPIGAPSPLKSADGSPLGSFRHPQSPSFFHSTPGSGSRTGGTFQPLEGYNIPPRNEPNNLLNLHQGIPQTNTGDISFIRNSPPANLHPQMQMNQPHYQAPQMMQQQQQQQQQQPNVAAPQILYMAVPTPDGRGQMLQPIQMVQMPGQQTGFVFPQASNMPGVAQPQMMVLPTTMTPQSPRQARAGPARGSSPYPQGGKQDKAANQLTTSNLNEEYLNGSASGASNGSSPDAISDLYSAPQRPPLDALLGHVRRLSRDQVGCRLLQQALDEEGPMAATLILNEGLSFWGEAMVDPFGNYLFQKILEKVTAQERVMLVKSVSGRLVNASLNLHGTRSVQKVVDLCAADESPSGDAKDPSDGTAADILTRSLGPAAARLCIDSHGNHVIQRILLKLGRNQSSFIFDAVAASVGDVARHRHGCCVIQRCLDSPPSEARSHLVHRIVEKCLELMQDAYGNYVVQYVLDVCEDEDVHAVCDSVVGKVCLLAIQKFSSNVMEKCLERCTDRVKEMYMAEISDPERIRELMMDPFGNYVVQRALSVASHAQAIRLVEAMRPHLVSAQPGTPQGQRNGGMRNTAGGRRIMAKISRRFPNFTLTPIGSDDLYSQNKAHHRKSAPPPQRRQSVPYAAISPGHSQGSPYGVNQNRRALPQSSGQMRQPYFDPQSPDYTGQFQTGYAPYPHI